MKKVLLIDPIYNPGTIPKNVPLCKIAAGLEACEIEVCTIDFLKPECEKENYDYFKKEEEVFLEKALNMSMDVDIVYITSGTGNELKPYPIFPRISALVSKIKMHRNVPIIVGGALMNLYHQVYNVSKNQLYKVGIDEIVVGNEYYGAMKAIVGKMFPLSVSPKWDVFKDDNYPTYKSVQYHVGCPYSCDFCFEGKIYDKKYDNQKLDDFVASINNNEEIIVEDSVIMSYSDFSKITDAFREKKVKYSIYARISEILNSPQKVRMLSDSGCQSLIVGIETLDSNVLQGHNKSIVSTQTRLALDILKEHQLEVQGCFMLGFPEDSIENMKRTIDFAINEKLQGYRWHIYQPNYSICNPNFSLNGKNVSVMDHFNIQLNVPDHCLCDVALNQPDLGMLDEHFMIRSKDYISAEFFDRIGYKNSFSYGDIKRIIDEMFPKEWILNEELLYKFLFWK